MGAEAHRMQAGSAKVRAAILTVSDTRTPDTDQSGQALRQMLSQSGHSCLEYRILPDEPCQIVDLLNNWLTRTDIQCILINGGTGISQRDRTVDAVQPLLERQLTGFGELFRMLSFQEIGPAAMLSRALAGVANHKWLFVMPGSTAAVRLAMEKLILPELPHLVYEIMR